MWNTVFVVSVVILSLFSVKAVRFEGDKCILKYTREKGVCTPLSACESAKQALKTNVHPQTCSFNNQMPIVCCTKSPLSINTTSRNDEFSNCAPLPSRAIGQGVKRTGQKAWNKCIDLAEEVFKCSIAQLNDFDGPSRKSPEIRLTGKSGYDRFKRQISPPAVLSLEMDLGPDTTPKSNTIDRINLCLKDKKPDRVIGGNPASMGEFPHMALLGFGETGNVSEVNWSCGGTLISDRWVMTAGHCVYARSSGYVNFVVLGSENLETTPKTYYKIVNRVLHPDYSASSVYNDIALLQLDRKVEFTSTVRPACLHTGQSVKGREFIATGWGTTTYRGEQSKQLLKVDLNLFSEAECKAKYPVSRKLKDGVRYTSQMCVGHKTEKKDTCQGDSGGPLQTSNDEMIHCTYLVIGIVSAGMGCGVPGQPSLYTRVSAFIPWIESIVWP